MKRLFLLMIVAAVSIAQTSWLTTFTGYVFFGFLGTSTDTFTVAQSADGVHWTKTGGAWAGQINAPQVYAQKEAYYFQVAEANDQNINLTPWLIGLADSSGTITTIKTIDWTGLLGITGPCYSGSWINDNGTLYAFVPCSNASSPTAGFDVYWATVTLSGATATVSNPTLLTVNNSGSAYHNIYDPKPWKIGSTYYLWVTKFTGVNDSDIELASASTVTGTYSMIKTGDWAGWHAALGRIEAPTMYPRTSTSWRLAMESLITFNHLMFVADCPTLDISTCSWTPLQAWQEDQIYRHGSVVLLNPPGSQITGAATLSGTVIQ